jgi:hypothetical protein
VQIGFAERFEARVELVSARFTSTGEVENIARI